MLTGRSVFVVRVPRLLARLNAAAVADKAARAHLASVWIRLGHGDQREPGLSAGLVHDLRRELTTRGIALWGWHVPWCQDAAAVDREARLVLAMVDELMLDGVINDAERTRNPARFQGAEAEAQRYTAELARELAARGKGFAFSSHDQPNLHRDLPFAEFLAAGQPALPQVYNRDAHPETRLAKSEAAYRPLLGEAFAERYMPTANGSIVGDGGFPDARTCAASAARFLDAVAARDYRGHSFWCWEEMPPELWSVLEARPA